jgi:hypothetical protein
MASEPIDRILSSWRASMAPDDLGDPAKYNAWAARIHLAYIIDRFRADGLGYTAALDVIWDALNELPEDPEADAELEAFLALLDAMPTVPEPA